MKFTNAAIPPLESAKSPPHFGTTALSGYSIYTRLGYECGVFCAFVDTYSQLVCTYKYLMLYQD